MKYEDVQVGGKELGPVNFRFYGDEEAAKRHIGEARTILGNLKQYMQRTGIIEDQGSMSHHVDVKLDDGTKIRAKSIMSGEGLADIDEIWIDVTAAGKKGKDIILGFIVKVTKLDTDTTNRKVYVKGPDDAIGTEFMKSTTSTNTQDITSNIENFDTGIIPGTYDLLADPIITDYSWTVANDRVITAAVTNTLDSNYAYYYDVYFNVHYWIMINVPSHPEYINFHINLYTYNPPLGTPSTWKNSGAPYANYTTITGFNIAGLTRNKYSHISAHSDIEIKSNRTVACTHSSDNAFISVIPGKITFTFDDTWWNDQIYSLQSTNYYNITAVPFDAGIGPEQGIPLVAEIVVDTRVEYDAITTEAKVKYGKYLIQANAPIEITLIGEQGIYKKSYELLDDWSKEISIDVGTEFTDINTIINKKAFGDKIDINMF